MALEDKAGCRGIEKNFVAASTGNGEREGRGNIVELDVGLLGLNTLLSSGTREYRGGDLVDPVGCILNLYVDTVLCKPRCCLEIWYALRWRLGQTLLLTCFVLHFKGKVSQVSAIHIAGLASKLQVGSESLRINLDVRSFVAGAGSQHIIRRC